MEVVELAVNDELLSIPVKRQSRKSLALHATREGGFEARAPLRMPFADVRAFIMEKQDWFSSVLAKKANEPEASALRYENGAPHWFLGQEYRLQLMPATRFFAHVGDGEIRLAVRQVDPQSVCTALKKFYIKEAEHRLPERVRFWHRRMYDRELPELKFRAMRSRWGSCASHGGITLNVSLLRAPLPVVDYVIVHELAHLTHFDHSPRFYALVAAVLPDWKQRQKQLIVPCGF